MSRVATQYKDTQVDVKVKLSGLWVSLMLCYIYGDYFALYKPGMLKAMLEGRMIPIGPVTQGLLVGTATSWRFRV
jgi:hypothetical protein